MTLNQKRCITHLLSDKSSMLRPAQATKQLLDENEGSLLLQDFLKFVIIQQSTNKF